MNVIWQPTRTVKDENGASYEVSSGYVVISEGDLQ